MLIDIARENIFNQPKHKTKEKGIEEMIRHRAEEKAKEIVMRTHQTMILEKQAVKEEWIERAIRQKTEELMQKMPRYLWD